MLGRQGGGVKRAGRLGIRSRTRIRGANGASPFVRRQMTLDSGGRPGLSGKCTGLGCGDLARDPTHSCATAPDSHRLRHLKSRNNADPMGLRKDRFYYVRRCLATGPRSAARICLVPCGRAGGKPASNPRRLPPLTSTCQPNHPPLASDRTAVLTRRTKPIPGAEEDYLGISVRAQEGPQESRPAMRPRDPRERGRHRRARFVLCQRKREGARDPP
jgi:hypothetical protein